MPNDTFDFAQQKVDIVKQINKKFSDLVSSVAEAQTYLLAEYQINLNCAEIIGKINDKLSECLSLLDNFYTNNGGYYFSSDIPNISSIQNAFNSEVMIVINYFNNNLHLKQKRKKSENNSTIFLVHGKNTDIRDKIYNKLKSEFNIKILEYSPNGLQSILDKFINESQDVGKAIVLLTKDDYVQSNDSLYYQARPNVFIELGYFIAYIGKENVVLVIEEGSEVPSGIKGIGYTPVEGLGKMIKKIKKELKI